MRIDWVKLRGFRNFRDAHINLRQNTLIIGANDVGKTNLLTALRLLFDRTLSDIDLDPAETDFYTDSTTGKQADTYEITAKIIEITKDAVLSSLKGSVSDNGETVMRCTGKRLSLEYMLQIGPSEELLDEIPGRQYLRYISLRYVTSQRDLAAFIRYEKRRILRLARDGRTDDQRDEDDIRLKKITTGLESINGEVDGLHYVHGAMRDVNNELHKIAHHHASYNVRLESGAIQSSLFVERLELAGTDGQSRVGLGGDGRNNQILIALWKAKSEREQDLDSEAIIYCVEEPEAHLHPHQQRKMAQYLAGDLKGQVLITSHSPQIVAQFRPDSIVRIVRSERASEAANRGCSESLDAAWLNMSYRMSILPAEAFFADMVFLVEGPSEVLFYHELARALEIDLDFHNISILSVDGVAFDVHVGILDALEIRWAARTDNDVFRVPRSNPIRWRFAGLNRALKLIGEPEIDSTENLDPVEIQRHWSTVSSLGVAKGVFIGKNDLEEELVGALPEECMEFSATASVEDSLSFFRKRKALNMSAFLDQHKSSLIGLGNHHLAWPLLYCVHVLGGIRQ